MKRTILTCMMTLLMIASFAQITSISNGESGSSVRTKLNSLITRYNLWPTVSTTNGYFLVGNGSNIVSESPATARASLGLVIGTDVQAYDADLTTLGAGGSGARDFLGLGTSDSPGFDGLFVTSNIYTPSISNDLGDILVEGSTFSGNNLTVPGDIYPTGEIRSPGDLTISANLQSDDLFLEGDTTYILANQFIVSANSGTVFGSPTGGAKGAGTINAVAIYDDNSLLSDYVFEKEFCGYTLGDYGQNFRRKSLQQEIRHVKKNYSLSTLPSREEWEKDRPSLGKLQQKLYETIEVQFLYIMELEKRISKLEKHK